MTMDPSATLLWVDDLDDSAEHLAGAKLARLGQMRRLGLQVPDGFAVAAAAFTRFLVDSGIQQSIDAALRGLDGTDLEAVKKLSVDLQQQMEAMPLPKQIDDTIRSGYEELCHRMHEPDVAVAVRSSAIKEDSLTRSFAGQYTTILGVSGGEAVAKAVRSCWASFFAPSALAYRLENGISHHDTPMAVGVVRLVQARSSGVAFSMHPVTGNRSRMVVEGSWGWGEAVVQGLVVPDRVELDAEDGRVLEYKVSDKRVVSVADPATGLIVEREMAAEQRNTRVLDDEELGAIARAVRQVEHHYGMPVDVEWVIDRARKPEQAVTLVQTRPITTVRKEAPEQEAWDPVRYSMKYGLGNSK